MNSKILNPRLHKQDKFMETFQQISDLITSGNLYKPAEDITETMEWLQKAVLYNVPHGKQIRGRMVEFAFKQISAETTRNTLELARVLGWCVEMLQASFLVADDIMDNGITRRGQPCWHRMHSIGNIAVNDSMLLEHTAFEILRIYFGNSEIYTDLLDTFLNVAFKTMIGQSLDTRLSQEKKFEKFSLPLYNSIVVHKTSYYTFFLPLGLAMILAGISYKSPEHKQLWKEVEEICKKIGAIFQIQDDYFDCFTDINVIGKVGTDIQEGKCTWLFLAAKSKCSTVQFMQLKKNYGSDEDIKVAAVKELYTTLELSSLYEKTVKELGEAIVKLIDSLGHSGLKMVLLGTVENIVNRNF